MDHNFAGELRYAVSSQSLDAAAHAKINDALQDLDSAIADVEQHPALPWRITAAIANKVHTEIVNAEIAAIRATRQLPPLTRVTASDGKGYETSAA